MSVYTREELLTMSIPDIEAIEDTEATYMTPTKIGNLITHWHAWHAELPFRQFCILFKCACLMVTLSQALFQEIA
jgi:hypothetical protein